MKTDNYIIDLGPEGGDAGETIVAQGTPEEIIRKNKGFTAAFLKAELNGSGITKRKEKGQKDEKLK